VKLLLDQNLSDRIISRISDLFPGSTHIKAVGLREADDGVVWEWAKQHGFTIASKDTDFHQRAILFGHPPKVIWLRVGNCQTSLITNLLRSRYHVVRQFIQSETESLSVSNDHVPKLKKATARANGLLAIFCVIFLSNFRTGSSTAAKNEKTPIN
jgi:predicted nuclease of predicted toxin-antitoxin system